MTKEDMPDKILPLIMLNIKLRWLNIQLKMYVVKLRVEIYLKTGRLP